MGQRQRHRLIVQYEDLRGNQLEVTGLSSGEIDRIRLVRACVPLDGRPDTEAEAITELRSSEWQEIEDRLVQAGQED
jgi:hypothetical protein